MGETVVLGLSGGVDSAVSAKLLLDLGYAVTGLYLDVGIGGAEDAAAVARSLGIPFAVASIVQELEERVCAPFAADYLAGRTPLPCARCNRLVKFPALLAYADGIGADWVATGHYARAEGNRLFRGREANDQSYLLARLTGEQLERVLFPLGDYEKAAVRQLARDWALPVAHKPDSMEICFVPDDDYAAWLEARGAAAPPGDFIDGAGRVLGRHRGIHCYTLGQRRGLGVSGPHRLFVSAIDPVGNTVTLSDGSDLGRTQVHCTGVNWLTDPPKAPFDCQVRLRHSRRLDAAAVTPQEGGRLLLESPVPFRAPTPGQLAVLYAGSQVLGSAWIQSSSRKNLQ